MRSRFLYYLLGSVLLHVVVLGFPFSVTTGSLGGPAMPPVRVHLLTGGQETMQKTAKARVEPDTTINTLSPEAPQVSKQPTGVALKQTPTTDPKASAVNGEPLTGRNTRVESKKRPRQPTKQVSLRTTTVYPGSAAYRPAAQSEAPTHTGARAAHTGTQHATPSANHGGTQSSQPESFSHARYARVVKPEYPEQARAQGWEGTTVLKVRVDPAGNSEQVRVQRTSGFNVLDNAAVNAMQQWEFHPARSGRKAVESWVSVPIVFKLKEGN